MKAIKSILIAILSAVCVLPAAACAQDPAPAPDPAKEDVFLAGFENWEDGFQLARIFDGFGRVSFNTDSQYVKTGSGSCRLDPIGYAGTNTIPFMYFPTVSQLFGFDYSDFTYADYVSVEVYNACGEEKTIRAGLVANVTSISAVDRVNDTELILQPGWNTCYINIDPGIVAIGGDITDIQGIYFMFENTGEEDVTESTPKYYLDDIRIIKKDEPSDADITFSLDPYEICNFEKAYQKYTISTEADVDLSVVNAAEYGIAAASGNKVLRALFHGTDSGYWKNIKIAEKLVQSTAIAGMTPEQAENAYLCFDVYNNYAETPSIRICLDYTTSGNPSSFLSTGVDAIYGEWVAYEYCLADVLAVNGDYLENPGALLIFFKDIAGERELFFDNFRIEIRN